MMMYNFDVPIFLRKRFSSIKTLAWQYMYPDDKRRRILQKYKNKGERKEKYNEMKEEVEELAKLLFLFSMYKFFNEGTQAAVKAIDIFSSIEISGFSVGSDIFEERNENVMRGERLANTMLSAVGNENVVSLIRKSEYMYQIVEKFKKLKNDK